MERKYSRVYRHDKRRFRYNFEESVLEYLDDNNEAIDVIGLSRENWKDNPKYWVEKYSDELDRDVALFMDDIFA